MTWVGKGDGFQFGRAVVNGILGELAVEDSRIKSSHLNPAARPAWWRTIISMSAFALVAILAQVGPLAADSQNLVNQLTRNADLFKDFKQDCPPSRSFTHVGGYDLSRVNRLPDDFGSVSVYGDYNIIYSARTGEKDPAFLFYTGRPDRKDSCLTLLVIGSGSGKLRLLPSVTEDNYREVLPKIASEEVDKLLSQCEANPRRAMREYATGQFVAMDDGQVFEVEGSFHCESAVLNTISAVDIFAAGKSARVVYVSDKMFLFEVPN